MVTPAASDDDVWAPEAWCHDCPDCGHLYPECDCNNEPEGGQA